MRRFWFFTFCVALLLSANNISAQSLPANQTVQSLPANQTVLQSIPTKEEITGFIQELQKTDPVSAQELMAAIQRGDFMAAKAIYERVKQSRRETSTLTLDAQTAERLNRALMRGDFDSAKKIIEEFQKNQEKALIEGTRPPKRSIFERTLSGDFPFDLLAANLEQFGYDTFLQTTATFLPPSTVPVGPDYIIGPGDQFTLTLWGTTEGIFSVQVTKEGNITLPKVGVVPVAGVRFGELEKTLRRHLSRYFRDFNLSVAMGQLRTNTIYVVGEVERPGSYPLHSLTTLYGALFAAGGPTKKGSMRNIQVLRGGKVIKTIDLYDFLLRGDRSQDIRLLHEDTVFVPLIGPVAGVAGAVYRPAIYELKGSESISDVIAYAGGAMPISLRTRIQVARFVDNKKLIIDINLSSSNPGHNEQLAEKARNMDVISVLPIYDKVWETVNLSGHVRHPGDYQWRPGLKLSDLIAMGQLLPTSDLRRAEVIRLKKDFMDREVIGIDIDALLKNGSGDIELEPKDLVRVYTTYREPEMITITGEVIRPGTYEIQKGEKLSDLLRRVGGFTPEAYVYGTVFKRKNVKESQARNLQSFITRMQSQILQASAQGAATALSPEEATFTKAEMSLNQSLLENLKTMREQQEGRVAIHITENIDDWAGGKDDLLLQDGDSIHIPKMPQEVLVMGEVYSPGAQVYLPEMTVKDYIERAGGYAKYAEKDEVFVIQANGFSFGADSPNVDDIEDVRLKAGDTVVVPQKVERFAGMRMAKDIIDILFKTAVVLATITVIF